VAWLVLEGPDTAAYWAHTTTDEWRRSARRWPGFEAAPVVALALFSEAAYERRYGEADKRRFATAVADWPVPYWVGDAAFAVLALLLGATDAGLGACFLGNFRGEPALLAGLEVPDDWRLFGAVAMGHPAAADPRSASLDRPVVRRAGRVHRGAWGQH
jgi:nitroreductase